jgi:signal transduction histidine kinase/CheY-like chemotaxis protein
VTSPLQILLLEDDPADAGLVQGFLEADQLACEITCVQTRAAFMAALEKSNIDLILADYRLPSFDGLSALELARDIRPELPFIFVSGTLGEETAIEALKRGATDYVLKTRLSRLVPAVQRALRETRERAERKKAEEALRRSELYLAEAQRLSQTGSFGWDISSGELYWSDETFRIFECERTIRPTMQLVIDQTHPDDRMHLKEIIDRASKEGSGFSVDHRLMMHDGRVKYIRAVARQLSQGDPKNFVLLGAVSDVTERKRAEQERQILRQLERELARINRVSMMGELAASLAHEVKQPIAAIAMNAKLCMRWLQFDPPQLQETRQAISEIMNGVDRASQIIDRNCALFGQGPPRHEMIEMNEIIREMVALLRDVATHHSISVQSDLDLALPKAKADRVQLQQVLMNLVLNGIEAMKEESGALSITSKRTEEGQLLVCISDEGPGLPVEKPERVFEAFFTTKPHGTGTGLSISRRIIESHGGHLWASANVERGATFCFTLPST